MKNKAFKTIARSALCCAIILISFSCIGGPPARSVVSAPVQASAAPEPDVALFIQNNDTQSMTGLFKGRELANKPGDDGRYPLHLAVVKGSRDMVELLVSMGAEVDPLDADGKTPLRYAVDKADAPIAQSLLAKKADMFLVDKAGVSPLDAAIVGGSVGKILDARSVLAVGPQGQTALHVAVDRMSLDSVRAILALNPDLAAKDKVGQTVLDSTFLHPNNPLGAAIAELLVIRNAPTSFEDFSYFVRAVRDTNYARSRFADGATVLHEAVRYDHRGYLQFFLDRGVSVDIKNASGATALHEAMRQGKIESAKILIAKGADVNARDGQGSTPLHLALPLGLEQNGITFLLENNADPSIKDKAGSSPLHSAVSLEYPPEVISLLLKKGAQVDSVNAGGDTSLSLAVKERHYSLFAPLAAAGASLFIKNAQGYSPLYYAFTDGATTVRELSSVMSRDSRDDKGEGPYHHAVRMGAASDSIAVLKELGFDPSLRNNDGDTALHLACRLLARTQGEALLNSGSDPFIQNSAGQSPILIALSVASDPLSWFFTPKVIALRDGVKNSALHYAAQAGLYDGVVFLVNKGTPVDTANNDGYTPLMLALQKDSVSAANALLSLGANPLSRDATGATPLHLAVYWAAENCLKLLAKTSATVDLRDFTGKTPLRTAVDKGDLSLATFLLEKGAEVRARDSSGETPLHAAARLPDERLSLLLGSQTRNVDIRDDMGTTPLLEAVYSENAKAASVLASLGASIHARDSSGESPLSFALKKGTAVLRAVLNEKTVAASDADGRSVLRVILEAKPVVDYIQTALSTGAPVDDRDLQGRTPLLIATQNLYYEIISRLVVAGADPFIRDAQGMSPAVVALTSGEQAVKAMFAGKVNAKDTQGDTALHYAAANGLEKGLLTMLALGADINIRNVSGESAYDVALRRGYPVLADLIKK